MVSEMAAILTENSGGQRTVRTREMGESHVILSPDVEEEDAPKAA
jgi:hypothetical protein